MRQGKLNAWLGAAAGISLLTGCSPVVLAPAGDIAAQQRDLLFFATALILVIVIPLILNVLFFAWRYRASGSGTYDPITHDSTRLTALVWSGPLVIITVLAATTWISTHRLDPYRPLARIGPDQPIAAGVKPLVVQVVALDWKWLFIYPDYGVASVNEMTVPLNVPVEFDITSSTVMNSFFIPAMAGQIYAMPGMQTKLNGVFNQPGSFDGFSANYSGAGFSRMRFGAHSVNKADFDAWLGRAKSGDALDATSYLALSKPSEADPVRYFGRVDGGLYASILNMCVGDPSSCQTQPMNHMSATGMGEPGAMVMSPAHSMTATSATMTASTPDTGL